MSNRLGQNFQISESVLKGDGHTIGFQDLHGLVRSVRHDNADISEFDTSCFSGEYVTGDVTEEYLHEIEERRNDAAKQRREEQHKGHAADDRAKPAGAAVGM